MALKALDYAAARPGISDGDLLLWKPTSLLGRLISVGTRSEFSHAGMAVWWHGVLMHLDLVRSGGRAVTLSSQVRRYPGRIVWFRANATKQDWDCMATVRAMIRKAGRPYGIRVLWRHVASCTPFVRLVVRPEFDDSANGEAGEVCSQGVNNTYVVGGVDPVPGRSGAWTTPGDLAQSLFFEREGALI